jgi:magnesium chelatase family protein
MLVKVDSIAVWGMDIVKIVIEVNVSSRGFPSFDIVGLPGKEISESKHRILTALQNSGIALPAKKIVINLAPADLPKEGSCYDLPISVGLVCALFEKEVPKDTLFYGEVSLDGSLRYTKGVFLAGLFAQEHRLKRLYIPKSCTKEVGFFSGFDVYGLSTLKELSEVLSGANNLLRYVKGLDTKDQASKKQLTQGINMTDIIGQEKGKRAVAVCAAGGHNLMLEGSPGAGKTMLAKSYLSLAPPLTDLEQVDVLKIYSIKGVDFDGIRSNIRPFRSPHHTVSYSGMLGGGGVPKPGEISLAHHGVLFMDEFPEFSRQVIEALRQPLEDGVVTVTRSKGTFVFPSKFILIAALNPCPCGYYGHPTKMCNCGVRQIQQYKKKLSGPLLDRFDLLVNVLPVEVAKLTGASEKNDIQSALNNFLQLKKSVNNAYEIQTARFSGDAICTNSQMEKHHIEKYCVMDNPAQSLLNRLAIKMDLSARAYFKILKVARTIADLEGNDCITQHHIAEALWFRN